MSNSLKLVDAMEEALNKADNPSTELNKRIHLVREKLLDIDKDLSGDKTKAEIGESSDPTPNSYRGRFASILRNSTYGPTVNHLDAFNLSKKKLNSIKQKLDNLKSGELNAILNDLKSSGAPWIEDF
jgi:hypothetical protein